MHEDATRSSAASFWHVLLVPFALPGAAFGQGQTWAGIEPGQDGRSGPMEAGALRVNAALELRNAGYDSDIYYGYLASLFRTARFGEVPVSVALPSQ